MTLTVHDVEQGSDAWLELRRGVVTASVIGQLIKVGPPDPLFAACPTCSAGVREPCMSMAAKKAPTPIKSIHDARAGAAMMLPPVYTVAHTDASQRATATLVAERITGRVHPTFTNDDMMRGLLHEPIARDAYADHKRTPVDQIGFMVRDDHGHPVGASPDGLIGDDGGLEIKCPRAHIHIATIIAGTMPAYHMPQIQTCLYVTGRAWWDYVSFSAGLPLFTTRIYPDPAWHKAIVEASTAFEEAAEQLTSDYYANAEGLPATEPIPDDIGLVF